MSHQGQFIKAHDKRQRRHGVTSAEIERVPRRRFMGMGAITKSDNPYTAPIPRRYITRQNLVRKLPSSLTDMRTIHKMILAISMKILFDGFGNLV